MRRCDENIINTFLFKTNFKTLVFLREYRRERSEFDVGPGLKFINIYIKVAIVEDSVKIVESQVILLVNRGQ